MNTFSHQIILKGCREHNLKNISLSLPKYSIIAITGVSGSGKSSLAFDTLFGEGQRRYLEYLSPQIRSWIKQMPKPDVDLIEGLSPTLAVGQKKQSLYSLGTLATYTDIYDFLSLLYAAIGEQHSPVTGERLMRYSREEMIHLILKKYPQGTKLQLLAPVMIREPETAIETVIRLQQMGFIRLRIDGKEELTEDLLHNPAIPLSKEIEVVVDRLEMKEGIRERLAASIETALDQSHGILKIQEGKEGPICFLSEVYVCPKTKRTFAPLAPADFNYFSPRGACPICSGRGGKEILDTGAVSDEHTWKICPVCKGARLKEESLACFIRGKNISTLCEYTVDECSKELFSWNFSGKEALIAKELLDPIQTRLHFLQQVGLGYLPLNRGGKTLSSGEAQRVQLAAHIGAKLSGLIYILDEPSLGLHRQDVHYLWQVIKELKELGNTVILVEHERALIAGADYLVELGPGAGKQGGNITFQGTYAELLRDPNSLTGQWLKGEKKFPLASKRKGKNGKLHIKGVSLHNIQNINLQIPLGSLVGFCGVSGCGKSTLVFDLIGKSLQKHLQTGAPLPFLEGYSSLKRIIMGEKLTHRFSSRSTPATYVHLMTPLRELFAETRLAKSRGYTAARFSLNKKGGRCEVCEGLGELRDKMQLLPDLFITCDVCLGSRYNYETLQVTWENHSFAEVLALSISESAQLFRHIPQLAQTLELLQELGLGYLSLGQPFHTLSGGEIQRLRLTSDLLNKSGEQTLYLLDEPSAGLHFEDIEKLLIILHRLVDRGHSVFMIEHHLSLLGQADWLIELGPGGGPSGGKVIFEGTVKKMKTSDTPTGKALSML